MYAVFDQTILRHLGCNWCNTEQSGTEYALRHAGWVNIGFGELCPSCSPSYVGRTITQSLGYETSNGTVSNRVEVAMGILTKQLGWTLQEILEADPIAIFEASMNAPSVPVSPKRVTPTSLPRPSLIWDTVPLVRFKFWGGWTITIEFKFPDLWIGMFFTKKEAWICFVPCFPIHIEKVNDE